MNSTSNLCTYCNTESISMKHFLLECPSFNSARKKFFYPHNISLYLGNPNFENIDLIISYLKYCNINFLI